MSTLPSASEPRTYPLPAPPADRRFTLGLVLAVIEVLVGHGYPPICSQALDSAPLEDVRLAPP